MRRARSAAERLRGVRQTARDRAAQRSARRATRSADSGHEPASDRADGEAREPRERLEPHLALVRAPRRPAERSDRAPNEILVATYNVHRWTGVRGRKLAPELAASVLRELRADVCALQEVLQPEEGPDPLEEIAETLGLHAAFVATRRHRRGALGNAVLSRFPITSAFSLDLSFGRMERRSALAVQVQGRARRVAVVATHLALVDRTRQKQVQSLLAHPGLQGPVILLGDMNAWRRCAATRELDREFTARHNNLDWPASFPAARPTLALDRIYARGAFVTEVHAHESEAARNASDHLPIIARVGLETGGTEIREPDARSAATTA